MSRSESPSAVSRASARAAATLRSRASRKFRGFTLVELIVVITILAILATIGFLALSGYTSDANKSAVVGNLRTVEKWLSTNATVTGKFPAPSGAVTVTYSGGTAWYQGTAGKSVMSVIGMGEPPKDPQGGSEFDYSLTANGMEYQVASAYLSSAEAGAFVRETSAAPTAPTAAVTGNYNGLFVPVSTGGTNYLMAAPSIILANASASNRELRTMSPAYVVDGKVGTPASWSGKIQGLSQTGISFGGTGYSSGKLFESATDAFPKESGGIAQLAANVAAAYSGTAVATLPKIAEILSGDSKSVSASVAAAWSTSLGRELVPNTVSAAASAGCQATTHSGYSFPVIGAGSSTSAQKAIANGTWTLSSTCSAWTLSYGGETLACVTDYVVSAWQCVQDVCNGTPPTGSEQNGTQQLGGTWQHSVTAGVCKFRCQAGRWWDNSACAQASPGYYVPSAGAVSQTAATAGYYAAGNGATAQAQCPADSYCPAASPSPTACPAGTSSPAGSTAVSACADAQAPTWGSFSVPASVSSQTVTLSVTCPTDNVSSAGQIQMAYGNAASPTNWTACAASVSHTLTAGDGSKTVYVRFKDAAGNATADVTGTTTLASTKTVTGDDTAGRKWSDGTYATSCQSYIHPPAGSLYSGSTGNGTYWVDADGAGPNAAFKTYCDMTTDGGGWTLVMNVDTSDGNVLHYGNALWTDGNSFGTFWTFAGANDFKAWPAFTGMNGRHVMVMVHNEWTPLVARSYFLNEAFKSLSYFFTKGNNVQLTQSTRMVKTWTALNSNEPIVTPSITSNLWLNTVRGLNNDLDRISIGGSITDNYGGGIGTWYDSSIDSQRPKSDAQLLNCAWASTAGCRIGSDLAPGTNSTWNAASGLAYDYAIFMRADTAGISGDDTAGRKWADGTYAASCDAYSAGSTTDGIYLIDPDGSGPNAVFKAYCDMTTDGGGWTLVGNTTDGGVITSANFSLSAPYGENYAKPLYGQSGTRLMYECGTSGQWTRGRTVYAGSWSWNTNFNGFSATFTSTPSNNATWIPDMPGYDSSQSDTVWHNHIGNVHYPNFGTSAFANVTPTPSGWGTSRGSFTCDPQNGAFWSGDWAWFSGNTGTRYVRFFLR